jgi:arylsulfatase A-like enzyme
MKSVLPYLLALPALLAPACRATALEPAPAPRPNILLIVADDLGYGDLGSYGQKNIRTPALDRLAAGGMRFTAHYAGSTVCAPSRSALMTGLHTGHTPIRGNSEVKPMGQRPLPDAVVTIAEILKSAGYSTALIGKWGLGGPGSSGEPNRQGFDYFFGYLCQRHAHNYYPEFLFRNTERVPLRNVSAEPKREDGAGVAVERAEYSADLIASEVLSFLDRRRDAPFFLAWTATLPHANNEAGARGMEVPEYGEYADRDWPEPQKGHAAMISRLDRDVGRVLDKLDALGLAANTLVLFTSDNGPHREGGNNPDFNDSNGPLRGIKRDLYEGGIRVPLIARWPGRIAAGAVSRHVCAFWDYLPTFATLAGAKPPDGLDGISFEAELTGRSSAQKTHDFLYWEFHEGQASKQAVRMGRWKGVRLSPSAPLELYDLDADSGETRDLAAAHPEVAARIREYLKTARTESGAWPLKGGAAATPPGASR